MLSLLDLSVPPTLPIESIIIQLGVFRRFVSWTIYISEMMS